VMRVKLSVNEEFAVPPAAKPLGEEVKIVKAWLQGSELFGVATILNEEGPPAEDKRLPIPPVDDVMEVSVTIGESEKVGSDAGVNEEVVSVLFRCSRFLVLIWT
jgi:hypothetical protein